MIIFDEYTKLSRLVVDKRHRGEGYGKLLTKELINYARDHFRDRKLKVEAQIQVVEFYVGLGFEVVSDLVMIEDYPHKRLELDFNK